MADALAVGRVSALVRFVFGDMDYLNIVGEVKFSSKSYLLKLRREKLNPTVSPLPPTTPSLLRAS